jgi:glucosamine--fructose-6-phosphate aminotransferase (isomerizing)
MGDEFITRAEILEQPDAIDGVLSELREQEADLVDAIAPGSTCCFVGCGTSYYLSLVGRSLVNRSSTGYAYPGSEVFVSPDQLPTETIDVIIPVSRSGESTETVRAAEYLADEHSDATTLAVTCSRDSTITELADHAVVSPFGAEEGLAMTKSFTSMAVALEYIATVHSGERDVYDTFKKLPERSESLLPMAEDVAEEIGTDGSLERFMFLGTGELYGLAAEAMLKLEEMSLSWTKAYHTLEFRHGPRSIADENTLVTVFLPDREHALHDELLSDVDAVGATTLGVGPTRAIERVDTDYRVELPDRGRPSVSLYAPAFQLLGYHRAVSEGLDPDEPQNLTQVVTF